MDRITEQNEFVTFPSSSSFFNTGFSILEKSLQVPVASKIWFLDRNLAQCLVLFILSVPQTVFLSDTLCPQLLQDVVQVARVGVAVARQVGAELSLVMDFVPNDCVGLSSRAGGSHREDQPAVPRHQQQLQHLTDCIWKVVYRVRKMIQYNMLFV